MSDTLSDQAIINLYFACFGQNMPMYNGRPQLPKCDEEAFNAFLLSTVEARSIEPDYPVYLCKIDGLGWIEVEKNNPDATHYGVVAMDRFGDENTEDLYSVKDMIYEVHLRR